MALADTLRKLQGSTTVVVVTHRQNLTQHVNKMLVIDGGRAVHYGSTQEVLAALRGTPTTAGGAAGAQVVPIAARSAQPGA
jgi:ABC-type bacteriocin/lantibiotic exporter with double-glycine peptidase domain